MLDVPLHEQYLHFLMRLPFFDFGPSLMAFPTPATSLVALALPVDRRAPHLCGADHLGAWGTWWARWRPTIPNSRLLKTLGVVFIGIQPIPYYIIAFLLVIVFGFLWPMLPISGGFAMNVRPGWYLAVRTLRSPIMPILPADSLSWSRASAAGSSRCARLASNIVTEDYVTFAELAAVRPSHHHLAATSSATHWCRS